MKVSISSPAKINLHLKILDKNSDGYHNLDTSFQYIDLYDFMTFEQAKDGILIDTNNSSLNAKENTIYKAAVSFEPHPIPFYRFHYAQYPQPLLRWHRPHRGCDRRFFQVAWLSPANTRMLEARFSALKSSSWVSTL